jgi:hypothetical protein
MVWASPRQWEKASMSIKTIEDKFKTSLISIEKDQRKLAKQMLGATIGSSQASKFLDFISFSEEFGKEDIVNIYPKKDDNFDFSKSEDIEKYKSRVKNIYKLTLNQSQKFVCLVSIAKYPKSDLNIKLTKKDLDYLSVYALDVLNNFELSSAFLSYVKKMNPEINSENKDSDPELVEYWNDTISEKWYEKNKSFIEEGKDDQDIFDKK